MPRCEDLAEVRQWEWIGVQGEQLPVRASTAREPQAPATTEPVEKITTLEGWWLCAPEMITRGKQLVRISYEDDAEMGGRQFHLG